MLKAKVRGTYITMMLNVLHKKQNGLQSEQHKASPQKTHLHMMRIMFHLMDQNQKKKKRLIDAT
jgi:hypothetical protein